MKHFEIEHNSGDWYYARSGLATTSAFDKIITPTGKKSAQAEDYAKLLLTEILLGAPIERNFSVYALEWGHQHEDDAKKLYAFDTGLTVIKGGFYTDDDMRLGSSPDARIFDGDKQVGLAEIKCPENPAVHGAFLIDNKINTKYTPQVQGQLYVSEQEWVDWFSYHPDLPPVRVRTYRDEAFIKKLEECLDDFFIAYDRMVEDLIKRKLLDKYPEKKIFAGMGMPQQEPTQDPEALAAFLNAG